MSWFTNFVSELTGDSSSKVSEAHHNARGDSGAREGKDGESFRSAPSWAESHTESGISHFSEGKGPGSSEKQ